MAGSDSIKKVYDFSGVVHAAGGVDARCDHEDEVDHFECAGLAAELDERADAVVWVCIDLLQSVVGEGWFSPSTGTMSAAIEVRRRGRGIGGLFGWKAELGRRGR